MMKKLLFVSYVVAVYCLIAGGEAVKGSWASSGGDGSSGYAISLSYMDSGGDRAGEITLTPDSTRLIPGRNFSLALGPDIILVTSPEAESSLAPDRRNNLYFRLKRDFINQAEEPLHYAQNHAIRLSLGLAGLGILIATDRFTHDLLSPNERNPRNKSFIHTGELFSRYGEITYSTPLIAGFGLYGWLAHSEKEMETFRLVTESLITSTTWNTVMKFGFGRERPQQTTERYSDWKGPFYQITDRHNSKTYLSFPSGHSSAIWSFATILAHQYPDHYIVPIISYTIATGVAYSRMVVNAHWLSDIVAGSLLGYCCARQVIRDNSPHDENAKRIVVSSPVFDFSRDHISCGLRFAINWRH